MNNSVHRLSLDIQKIISQASVPVHLGTTAKAIEITLTDGVLPYDLTSVGGAVLWGSKSDGTEIINNCTCSVDGDTITYSVTEQTSAAEGVINCQLTLYGANGKILATPHFTIVVIAPAARAEGVTSTDEYLVLNALIAEANAVLPQFKACDCLPEVTSADNGKFLRVADGIWMPQTIPIAEEETY